MRGGELYCRSESWVLLMALFYICAEADRVICCFAASASRTGRIRPGRLLPDRSIRPALREEADIFKKEGSIMYMIRCEQCFDSAHFLAGYVGKCSNLHGHRWRVVAEVCSGELPSEGALRGMVTDFGDLKRDLREITDGFDHALIYEAGTLRDDTVRALTAEHFALVEVPFRPTAELFAKHFYELLEQKGYAVRSVEVYETPNNCAVYSKDT